jgi:hypothetical protein
VFRELLLAWMMKFEKKWLLGQGLQQRLSVNSIVRDLNMSLVNFLKSRVAFISTKLRYTDVINGVAS